ncbi:MAG: UvrB/UvrC motif-containing protein [Eubacteriales bacterium]|nr:UvrB/UvrC motif-containing protein [Eubacteriales bacterium]
MKCQYCKNNEADRIFFVNWMGVCYETAMCSECLEKLYYRSKEAGQEEMFKRFTDWWPGKPRPRSLGDTAFSEKAPEGLILKRQLNELRQRLKEAAGRENYEEAARLRDDIARMEKEVCSYEK